MNQVNHESNDGDHAAPSELLGVAGALDRLGAMERDSAPAGLEDRLFASTKASLGQSPGVVARIGGGSVGLGVSGWRFRLAASVMIAAVGVVAAVWVQSRGGVGVNVNGNVTTGTGSTVATGTGSLSSAELAKQIEADLSAWTTEVAGVSSSDTEVAALHTRLSEIESGGDSADPWDAIEVTAEESAL